MNGHGENWNFSSGHGTTNADTYLASLKRGLQTLLTRQEEDTDPRSRRFRAMMIKNQRRSIQMVELNNLNFVAEK